VRFFIYTDFEVRAWLGRVTGSNPVAPTEKHRSLLEIISKAAYVHLHKEL
jgi:hypothetical protein